MNAECNNPSSLAFNHVCVTQNETTENAILVHACEDKVWRLARKMIFQEGHTIVLEVLRFTGRRTEILTFIGLQAVNPATRQPISSRSHCVVDDVELDQLLLVLVGQPNVAIVVGATVRTFHRILFKVIV